MVRAFIRKWCGQYINYIKRPVKAFFKMPGSRSFGILLVIFAMIIISAVIDLNFNYIHPETGQHLDTFAAIYAVFALLVFETPLPLPTSWITRLAFFAVPISGILVLGQGLIRLGSPLLNRDVWNRAMASTYEEHTIVCGLGKVSLRVTRWVLDLNEVAIIIEKDPHNPYLDEARSWGVPIIIADARRPETLEDAGIRMAESIVPCTNDDLINLNIALEARRLTPNIKVVLRMADMQMAQNVHDGFNLHTVFSIPEIAAPAFAAAATKAPLDHAFAFGEDEYRGILTITKFTLVPESVLVGYTVGALETEFNIAVIAHRSEGNFQLHPHNDVIISVGDGIVVSASIEGLNKLAGLTPPTREMPRYLQGRWPLTVTR